MPIVDFACMSADETIFGASSGNYAAARATATNTYTNIGITNMLGVGVSTYFRCYRAYLKFDTTTLPAGSTINQVNLKLVCVEDYSVANFNVDIMKYAFSDPVGTYAEANYDGCLTSTKDVTWRNTNGMSLNTQYTSPNMSTAWPTAGGYTRYCLMSERDRSSATGPDNNEYINIASQDHATSSYRPILTIDYTPISGRMLQAIFMD